MGVPSSPVGDYAWAFTVKTGTTFTARATPNTTRQTVDGWLSIDQNGTKATKPDLRIQILSPNGPNKALKR